MNKQQTLLEFFTSQTAQIDIVQFVINLLLAGLLAYLLGRVYVRFGTVLANREMFSRNFMLLTMTTMVIITIVKSSLALSLGLVGALSIIRFRAAIKEPEELAYLFLAISIGLGLGASQTIITTLAFVIMVAVIISRHFVRGSAPRPNLYLTISHSGNGQLSLPQLVEAVNKFSRRSLLKRYDEGEGVLEASFQANFDSVERVNECTRHLRSLSDSIRVSLHEDRGLGV
ncbi:MAG TPA: DUF4956 domain-containing protein [Verrucomicrobiales bacterium]|nr:DUF4956 domain-containing protein [Verrucomicrobiales bacterium]